MMRFMHAVLLFSALETALCTGTVTERIVVTGCVVGNTGSCDIIVSSPSSSFDAYLSLFNVETD